MKKALVLMFICVAAKAATTHDIYLNASTVPVVSTTQYGTGQQMGRAFNIRNIGDPGAYLTLEGLKVIDKDKQAANFDILLFNDEPVLSSVDGGALDISDAEMGTKFVALENVVRTDYRMVANSSVAYIAHAHRIHMKLKNGSTGLWGVMRSNGNPTYTSSDALLFEFYFKQD